MADYSKTLLAALNRQSKKDSQAKYEFVVVDPDTLKFTIDFKPHGTAETGAFMHG